MAENLWNNSDVGIYNHVQNLKTSESLRYLLDTARTLHGKLDCFMLFLASHPLCLFFMCPLATL